MPFKHFLLSFLLAVSFAAPAFADVSVSFQELQGNQPNSFYTFAVIRQQRKGQTVPESNQKLAKALLDMANNWSVDIYRERYPEKPAEKYEAMRKSGISLTENSSFVMVIENSDPYKILGTLWTAYPDENGKIDLEKSLDWTYPRVPVKASPYPMFENENGVVVGVKNPVLTEGGVVEFKRLVLDPRSPRELMPAMLLRGESDDRLNTQPIINDQLGVLPAEYALYCDRKLVPIYLRFGFKPVQAEPVKGDFVMKIDRVNYVGNAVKWLEKARSNGWNLTFTQQISKSEFLEKAVRKNLSINSCRDIFIK